MHTWYTDVRIDFKTTPRLPDNVNMIIITQCKLPQGTFFRANLSSLHWGCLRQSHKFYGHISQGHVLQIQPLHTLWETSSHLIVTFLIVQVFWHLPHPHTHISLKMTWKHQPITGFMGLISLPLQFLFAAPNSPLKQQTRQWLTVNFHPPELKSSGSPSILCCSGTCPEPVPPHSWGALNVPAKKALSPSRGRKKPLLKTQQIWL